ncbi:MAG: hypothetical protein JNM62_04945 [Flavobacteriales bacterium]|nr:hypothetical protein [Flavobacteriales bacterium]
MKSIRTLAIILLCWSSAVQAQGGKAFLKEGDAFRKEGQLEKALEKYDLAVSVDPKLVKAFQARAEVNEMLGKKQEVARDRKHIALLVPEEATFAATAAMAYLEIDSPAVARRMAEIALTTDAKNMLALQAKTRACLKLGDLDCATAASDAAINLKGTTDTYYLHGLVRTATRDYETAEADLDRVIEWNHLYEPAYVAQAEVQLLRYERYSAPTMQMRTLEKAIEKCRLALELNPQSTDALFWRSKAYAYQKEYAKAIDDISRCMALGRTDRAVYYQRALYYHGFGQHQNAVNDLNKILVENPKDVPVLLLRAECKEANLDMEGALKDLETAQKAMQGDVAYGVEDRKRIEEARTRIAHQVFEMNRESDAPRLTVVEPFSKDSVALVSASLNYLKVTGHILDKSLLKAITVNGATAEYDREEKDPQFFANVPWGPNDKEIVVQAVDVYDNLTSVVLKVERSEGVPPTIALTSPSVGDDRVVSIEAGKESVFVEGKVSDGSPIRLIAVNGVNASYAPDQMNPDFSIKVEVKDKDRFTVRAEDQFGNSTDQVFTLVRRTAAVAVVPPKTTSSTTVATPTPSSSRTGTTWIIHIENSNYRNFPAVQSSGSEASKMQKAFANYSVSKTINKKNLTKEQLDRFFNIELRDLVRTNKVSTILVWYSGHGKSVGGKAYWVPIDARKDDIYSYFNYGSLKAQMQNYSESVDKTVVVSDAAGSDASFYELTR